MGDATEHDSLMAAEQRRRAWWENRRLIRWANTPSRCWQLALVGAVVVSIVSLLICVVIYWIAGILPTNNEDRAVAFGMPFFVPLTISPIPFAWFLRMTAELETRSRALEGEIARRRVVEATLEKLVSTDDLTGLPNRRAFFAQAEIRANGPATVALLDLDHFKRRNDLHGHAAGDEALRVLGAMLADAPGTPFAARLGGEEFGLIYPDLEPEEALPSMNELRKAIGTAGLGITASLGAAHWLPGTSIDSALASADIALYHAKSGGRDRVEVFRGGLEMPGRAGGDAPHHTGVRD